MSTFFFDFDTQTDGNGTPTSPFKHWSAATAEPGNTYLFKRGTTLEFPFRTVKQAKYGAWYKRDGSDDETQPKPIVMTTVPFSDYGSNNKDQVEISNWDIRAALPLAKDAFAIYCGMGATIKDCDISSSLGCIAIFGKSGVQVLGNRLAGLAIPANTFTNCVLCVASEATAAATSISIRNNIVRHQGGGSRDSHAVRVEGHPSNPIDGLVFEANLIGPPVAFAPVDNGGVPGQPDFPDPVSGLSLGHVPGQVRDESWLYCQNESAIGLRLANCHGATISNNRITGMLTGIFLAGGAPLGSTISGNRCLSNRHYGIHLTSDTENCLIEHNVCSNNGTSICNAILRAYGRGIELSSAAGQGKCKNHVVRFNTCEYNRNYGGPADNASEGVGIGLDDGTCGCSVYGNVLRFNEGNGLQIYGFLRDGASDTSNKVVANFFYDNCTHAYRDRRSGGTTPTIFIAQLSCAFAVGGETLLANNVFGGASPVGIYVEGHSNKVKVTNNLFLDVPHCVMLPPDCDDDTCKVFHNSYYSRDLQAQMHCTDECDSNHVPLYKPFAANPEIPGTNNLTFDKLVSSSFVH